MSGKWTPGPWHCHRNSDYWEFGSDERGQLGDVCASAFNANGREPDAEQVMEANARLISASPQMFDALKEMVGLATGPCNTREMTEALDRARAALAKAKGEGA